MNDSYKVTVITWGTMPGANRFSNQLARILYKGDNEGHAAIKLTFPADDRGKGLIEEYCVAANYAIPYKKQEILDPETGKKTVNYEVYFSFWPDERGENIPYVLQEYEVDQIQERLDLNVKRSNDSDLRYVSKRRKHSLLGKRNITLGPFAKINFANMEGGKEHVEKYKDLALQEQLLKELQNPESYGKEQITNKKLEINLVYLYEKLENISNYCNDEINFCKKQIQKLQKQNKNSKSLLVKQKNLEDQIKQYTKEKDFIEILIGSLEVFFYKHFKTNIKNFINYGRDPDHSIDLPLVDFSDSTKSHQNSVHKYGLDLESMLKMMKQIANDKVSYYQFSKNCASTCLKIIEAGIRKQDRDWMADHLPEITSEFKERNVLYPFNIVTPQRVYNSSVNLQKNLAKKTRALLFDNRSALGGNEKKLAIKKFLYIVTAIKKMFVFMSKMQKGLPKGNSLF